MASNDITSESREIAEAAMEMSVDELNQEFGNYIRPTVEDIKLSAKKLLNWTIEAQHKRNAVIGQINSLNFENEYATFKFSKEVIDSEKKYTELMNLVFDFQEKVNQFLGQTVILTYVYISPSSGRVELYAIEENMKAFKPEKRAESKGGDINGRINQSVIKKYGKKILANSDYNENGKKTLDRTFQETWQRFRISKSKFKMGGAAYILWKTADGWDGRKVSGAGPLGEAYVAFFMNEINFPSNIEKSVCKYIIDENYGVIAVDSASGFLQGDVTRGSMEFAVKTGKAPAPGYMEIIKYAQIIKEENVEEYLKNLKQTLNKEGKRNAINELTPEIKRDIEKDLLSEYSKRDSARINVDIPIFKN